MNAERWELVKSVVAGACTISGDARKAFLDQRCGSDSELRNEVESLVSEHDSRPSFLETPAVGLAAHWLTEDQRELGAYRILKHVGSGGMADVYLAERADGAYHKQVAIKILKHGLFSGDMLRRFNQEREVLANLDHPHIVRLLDGGMTNDGRPYFVMDYVDGASITDFARENSLSTSERLGLFNNVCEAVGYLHQNGIVHRDLKPGNITVNKQGQPKLLDFGIAKLLEPLGSIRGATQTGFRCFTPEYASPEQMHGKTVGPQSDVYSLGLLLYELSGNAQPSDVLHLDRLPRGLAKMITRATQVDPEKRFGTVDEFAKSVRAYSSRHPREWITTRRMRYAGILLGLVPAVVGAGFIANRSLRETVPGKQVSPIIHRLTSYPGMEDHATISPKTNRSAAYVAFGRSGGAVRGIWMQAIFSGDTSQITNENDCCPKWSPSGDVIAFARRVGENRYDISLISSGGGAIRTLAQVQGREMSWRPDGKALAVVDRSPEGTFSIYLHPIDGGQRLRLTVPPSSSWGDTDCAFSPDGRDLAVIRYASGGNGDVYVLPSSGGEARRITQGEGWISGISWTRDSKEIIFAATRAKAANKAGLWRVSTAPGTSAEPKLISLPRLRGLPMRPAVDDLGLFFQADSFLSYLWKLQLDSSARALPERFGGSFSKGETPSYSPDGTRIAAFGNPKGDHEIWTMNTDGSNPSQVTHTRGLYTTWPAWSPDGARIAYISNTGGKTLLYVVSSAGGASRQLPIAGYEAGAPRWSHDGRAIYFRCEKAGSSQICKIAADGSGAPVQVTRSGGVEGFESSDGTALYFVRTHDYGPVMTIPAAGGAERLIHGSPRVKAGFWTLTGKNIYFVDIPEGDTGERIPVKRFNPATRKIEVLGWINQAAGRLLTDISVRFDEKEMVWVQMERGSDLMAIEGFR